MRIRHMIIAAATLVLMLAAGNADAQQWKLVFLAGEHTADPLLAAGPDQGLAIGTFAPPLAEPMKKYFVLAERGVFMHPKIEGMAQAPAGGAVSASASASTGGAVTTIFMDSSEWTSYGVHAVTLVTAGANYECFGAKVTESPPLDPSSLDDGGAGLTDPRMYALECLQWSGPTD